MVSTSLSAFSAFCVAFDGGIKSVLGIRPSPLCEGSAEDSDFSPSPPIADRNKRIAERLCGLVRWEQTLHLFTQRSFGTERGLQLQSPGNNELRALSARDIYFGREGNSPARAQHGCRGASVRCSLFGKPLSGLRQHQLIQEHGPVLHALRLLPSYGSVFSNPTVTHIQHVPLYIYVRTHLFPKFSIIFPRVMHHMAIEIYM